MFQKLEKEAYELMEVATSGKFLDPSQNPTHILIAMKRVGQFSSQVLIIVCEELFSCIHDFYSDLIG